MQPRILAQTTVIERHVIRSEVPALVIDAIGSEPAVKPASSAASTEDGQAWRGFVDAFIAETRFDDPGQPSPRGGGRGWIKIPLLNSLYVNAWRSVGGRLGIQVRFAGSEGSAAYAELAPERATIDQEFIDQGLPAPEWRDDDVPLLYLGTEAPLPWNAQIEAEQRAWLGRVANQFVNSLRPRLQRAGV